MKIEPFKVEIWMNEQENKAVYNTGETCVDSLSVKGLLDLAGIDKEKKLRELSEKRLTYGHIFGNPAYRKGIASLYENIGADDVLATHGASSANHLALYSLVEPEDEVVAVLPTYQQLYSIPESFGATVKKYMLSAENNFLPDLSEIEKLVTDKTKIIVINNPNNPTGALMNRGTLEKIADMAKRANAYVLTDETYRGLTQDGSETPSIVDLYGKEISVSSMSKVFSLAGLRLGWVATRDAEAMKQCILHRDHDTISCGMLDEELAAIALEHKDKILARNRKIVLDNLRILDEWVAKEPHISYVKPRAGTTALLFYDFDRPSRDLCLDLIDNHGLLLTPGECFEIEHCVRIGYACETRELVAGLKVFSERLAAEAQ